MMKRATVAFAAVFAMSAAARADGEKTKSEAAEDDAAGGEAADKPAALASATRSGRMTLPGGAFYVNGVVESNLGKGAAGTPISIAPDLWYGASDKLTLGLVHSSRGATGFLTGFVNGLCFHGGDGGGACAGGLGKIYTTVGAEGRIAIHEGNFAVAVPVGLYASSFNPDIVLSAKVGLIGRWQSGPIALELQPSLFVGITQRQIDMGGTKVSNNEDRLGLPLTVFYQLSPAFGLAAQTGVTMVVEHAADTYQVPVALGLAWWATPKLSVDLAFGLTAVVDANSMTKAFDGRNLTIGVGYGM